MSRKKQKWDVGDCFSIKLDDGSFAIGQVVGREPMALNSAICAFFFERFSSMPVDNQFSADDKKVISLLFVTRDLLDCGTWEVFSKQNPMDVSKYMDMESLRSSGFIGATIIGSMNIVHLVNAFFGLREWKAFKGPFYLDKLLLSADRIPNNYFRT